MKKASYQLYASLRDSVGYNDIRVAKVSKLSHSTLSVWKSGRSIPKIDTLEKIAYVLGCDVQAFFEESTPQTPITYTADEIEVISAYRSSDELTKEMVHRILALAKNTNGIH